MASLPVRDVYRHVIDEVMKSVKNDFYQEGLDDPVIRQVQTLWEVALEETNAVSVPNTALDVAATGAPTLEPISGASTGASTGGAGGGATSAYADTYPYHGDLTGALGSSVYGGATGADGRAAGSAVAAGLSGRPASSMAPTHVDQSQAYLSSLPNTSNGGSNVPQLDGQCDDEGVEGEDGEGVTMELLIDDHTVHHPAHPLPTTSARSMHVPNTTRSSPSTTATKRQPRFRIPQVDGSQDGASNKEGGTGAGAQENEEEEFEELGSDDDISDSEEEVNNQDDGPRNRLIAQFDKVNRAKTKWKCTLRDGVIHINGRDHLFFKATGDFIWK